MQLVTRGGEMVAAVGSGLALYWYVGNPGVVQGASMMPTFPACCSVVWFSALFRPHALRVGDVVSATVQGAFMEEVGVVKRVRGVAGDLVLDELSGGVVLVPEGCVWLLGDNAEESRDSRHYGPVKVEAIRAKVVFQIFPRPGRVPALPEPELERVRIGHVKA